MVRRDRRDARLHLFPLTTERRAPHAAGSAVPPRLSGLAALAIASVTACAIVFSAGAPARAYLPALSSADVSMAVAAGRDAARRHLGLAVQRYVAYSVPDTLTVRSGAGAVDTVVVGTPYERVLYASYLAAFQGDAPTSGALAQAETADTLDVIVFGHARDQKDQGFLRRFKSPVLRLTGHTLRPTSAGVFGPGEDFFNGPDGRELLWLGYATYRFDLRPIVASGIDVRRLTGHFEVTDPYGRTYDIRLDLAKYR